MTFSLFRDYTGKTFTKLTIITAQFLALMFYYLSMHGRRSSIVLLVQPSISSRIGRFWTFEINLSFQQIRGVGFTVIRNYCSELGITLRYLWWFRKNAYFMFLGSLNLNLYFPAKISKRVLSKLKKISP